MTVNQSVYKGYSIYICNTLTSASLIQQIIVYLSTYFLRMNERANIIFVFLFGDTIVAQKLLICLTLLMLICHTYNLFKMYFQRK